MQDTEINDHNSRDAPLDRFNDHDSDNLFRKDSNASNGESIDLMRNQSMAETSPTKILSEEPADKPSEQATEPNTEPTTDPTSQEQPAENEEN